MRPTPSYLYRLYLQNGSFFLAETFSLFLTHMYLPTVKIGAKSVTSIEQRSAGIGHGLRAMPPKGENSTAKESDRNKLSNI
jgi:hypothetical protein